MKFASVLVLAGLAPAWAEKLECDVSWQIPGPPIERQQDLSACHAFAATRLLEAAIRRSSGKAEMLSPADLLVMSTVGSPWFFRRLMDQGDFIPRLTAADIEDAFNHAEGGDSLWDLRVALWNGVARRKTVPWGETIDNYRDWRDYTIHRLLELQSPTRYGRRETKAEVDALFKRYPTLSLAVRLVLMSQGFPHREDELKSLAQSIKLALRAQAIAHSFWAGKLDPRQDLDAQHDSIADLILGRNDQGKLDEILRDRADVRKAYNFEHMRIVKLAGGSRVDGAAGWIRRQLCGKQAARPVVFGIDLHDLDGWRDGKGERFKRGSFHIFVLTGYGRNPEGARVFKSRNSWGLNYHDDVPEDALSKIPIWAAALAAPGEPD